MSWWVHLNDSEGNSVTVDRHAEGGTYAMEGTTDAELNVTYNYGKHFNFRSLDGLSGAQAQAPLKEVIARLNGDRDPDYWSPTEGNARRACEILLGWAQQHPNAVFDVS